VGRSFDLGVHHEREEGFVSEEFTMTCKRCSKPFTLVLAEKMAQAMEKIRRSGSEPVGTCPACRCCLADPNGNDLDTTEAEIKEAQ
jgi:hypothetical protein